jgi:tripartite-type tricarboxylate transporter receptor subunit TctC
MTWCSAVTQGNAVKLPCRRFVHLVADATIIFAILIALPSPDAWSQTKRTIKIIDPAPPGGSIDIVARLLAEHIGRTQGTTTVVENRSGGGSTIGTEAVARATPDGNTLLIVGNVFVIMPHLRKLNYDPITSFEPICYLVRTPMVIVVNKGSPYRSLSDLINAARAKPGELTLASAGPATTHRIGFEMLKRAANVDINNVLYAGTGPAVPAILGGHVTSLLAEYPAVAEQIESGSLRALAVTSANRSEFLADVPTLSESGYKGYEVVQWLGAWAPANTSKEAASQLAALLTAAIRAPEINAKLTAQGFVPVGMCGADFGAFVRKQYDDYGRVIREANIKID